MTISIKPTRWLAAPVAASMLLSLAACGSDEAADETTAASGDVESGDTLAEAIAGTSDLGTVSNSMKDAGLAQVFDGAGSYTIFAPEDAAFEKLGDDVDLKSEEQRAAVAAILRDHIVPGYLTPEDIASAVDSAGGSVDVKTMGDHTIRFAREGDKIVASSEDGAKATLGQATLASNGVAIKLDGVLKEFPQS